MTPITIILVAVTILAFSEGMLVNAPFGFAGYEYVPALALTPPLSLPPGFPQPPPLRQAPPFLVHTGYAENQPRSQPENQPYPYNQYFPSYALILDAIKKTIPAPGGSYSGISASSYINSKGEGATDLNLNINGMTYQEQIKHPKNTQQ